MKRELHHAKVLKLDDPDKVGAAQLQVNEVVDGAALDLPDYVPGRYPFAGGGEGFYYAPQEGSLLEVEMEEDPEQATEELAARWVGMLYSDEDEIPSEFQSDAENRGGIKFGAEVFLQDKTKALTALISAAVRLGEEAASHPLMRGDTYNMALETFLTALDAYLTAESTFVTQLSTYFKAVEPVWKAVGALVPPALALEATAKSTWQAADAYISANATFKAAASTFKAAKTTWLSTKCKTE